VKDDPQGAKEIQSVREHLERSIELLTREDVFGAVLELQKARTILNSLPEASPRQPGEATHEWAMLDPYTAECRLCGKKRPLGIEERTLTSLAQD
jgi:hypothetical protein